MSRLSFNDMMMSVYWNLDRVTSAYRDYPDPRRGPKKPMTLTSPDLGRFLDESIRAIMRIAKELGVKMYWTNTEEEEEES